MSQPKRIQRKRTKGWRMPEGAVYVGRPSKWGNPYTTSELAVDYPDADERELRRMCTSDFRGMLEGRWGEDHDYPLLSIAWLAGRDLACWCPLDQPCHADVLLELVNEHRHERDVDPYDRVVYIQGHRHSEPICAWPDCQTYLTREQMAARPDVRATP